MKRITALFCAAVCLCIILCSCSEFDNTVNSAKNKASEAVSGMEKNADRYSTDNNGLFDDNTEPTNAPMTETEYYTEADETEDEGIMQNIDEMIDNGEVEDGDGNVGDLENSDGDPYIDENAAEYAQQASEDDDTD